MKRSLIATLAVLVLPLMACIENNITTPETTDPSVIAASKVAFPDVTNGQVVNLAVDYSWNIAGYFTAPKDWKPGVVLSRSTQGLQIVPAIIPVNGATPDQDGNLPYFLTIQMTSFLEGQGMFCIHPAGNANAEKCIRTLSGRKG